MAGFKDILTNKKFRRIGIIFAGEVISGIGAVLITPLLDKFLHSPNNSIRRTVAGWIEPHVKDIEESPAHQMLHAEGEAEGVKQKDYHKLPKRGRAERITDILLQGGSLFLLENGMSTGAQMLLKKMDVLGLKNDKEFKPLQNGLVGVTAHLGCIALFGTVLEKPTEWVYRKLAKVLQKVAGMDEEKAIRSASSMTFVVGPGLVAFLAEALWANKSGMGRRK